MAAVTAARAEARAAMMRRANKAAEIIPPRAYDFERHLAYEAQPTAPRTDATTPKDALARALDACPPDQEPVVLYACGSLLPIHLEHVANLERAKAHAERRGFRVVGGYVATSNDLYVRRKYAEQKRLRDFLPHAARRELIGLALEDHGWLRLDAWDGEPQKRFVEFWAAQASLAAHLDAWCDATGRRRVAVVGVHGSDLANKCRIVDMFRRLRLRCCIVERPNAPLERPPDGDSDCWVLPGGLSRNLSSTDAQRLLREGRGLDGVLHPSVARRFRELLGEGG